MCVYTHIIRLHSPVDKKWQASIALSSGDRDMLKCFVELGPPSSCALWFATAGALSCWRRDPICWSLLIQNGNFHSPH